MLAPHEIIPLDLRARKAVLEVRAAILQHREIDDSLAIRWENLTNRLFLAETEIGNRVLPHLDARGMFANLGPSAVKPISLRDVPSNRPHFIGKMLPLKAITKLRVVFPPSVEKDLRETAEEALVLTRSLVAYTTNPRKINSIALILIVLAIGKLIG